MCNFRQYLFSAFCCLLATVAYGQTFQGQQNLPIPPDPLATEGITISPAAVSGVGTLGGCKQLERVLINIDHTWVGDVAIFLISPDGTALELTSSNGGAADDWRNTEFIDDAPLFITEGNPPYTGQFRPEGRQQSITEPFPNTAPLGTFTLENTFTGEDADGEWQLYVNDFTAADVGVILNWELEFSQSNTSLEPEINNPSPNICAGSTANLSVTGTLPGGTTFAWSTGGSGASISVSPTVTTDYSVTVSNAGCEEVLETQVVVDAPVTFDWSVDNDLPVCPGDLVGVRLSFDRPINVAPLYRFRVENDQSGDVLEFDFDSDDQFFIYFLTVQQTTIFTVTVIPPAGACPIVLPTNTVTVPVAEAATPVISGPTEVCAGNTIRLTASGGTTYQWSTGATTDFIDVSPSVTTTYSVNANPGNDCSGSAEVTVNVRELSAAAAADQPLICIGESVELSASGGGLTAVYNWSDGQPGASITVAPTTSTNYTVTITEDGCTATAQAFVTVTPAFTLSVADPDGFCAGDPVTLTALGAPAGTTYVWSNGGGSAQITPSPLGASTYSVTATSGGCTEEATITVTPTARPQIELPDEIIVCSGDPISLTNTGDQGTSAIWNDGTLGNLLTANATATTTYELTVFNGDCSSSGSVIATVPEPAANLGPDRSICAGEALDLFVTGVGAFSWSTGAVGQQISVNPTFTTTYQVTATDQGCVEADEIIITVLSSPTVTASPDQDICTGTTATLEASGDGPFSWSTGEVAPTITVQPTATTTYTVAVGNGSCATEDEVIVTLNPSPSLDLGEDRVFCAGEATELTATGTFSTISWNTGETTSTIPLHTSGTRVYEATAAVGECTLTASVSITILASPSVATDPDQAICAGDSLTLRATGTGPFRWSTGEVADSITVQPTATTTYTVAVGSDNCAAAAEVVVTVRPVPNLDLGPDQDLCREDTLRLFATPGFDSYNWSNGNSSPDLEISPLAQDTILTLTVSQDDCLVTDTVSFTVDQSVVNLGPDRQVCPGDSLDLNGPAAATAYLWNTGATTQNIRTAATTFTLFTLVASFGDCVVRDTVRVRVTNDLALDLPPTAMVCPGETLNLVATGTGPFRWNTGAVADSIIVQPLEAQTLYFAEVGTGNCAVYDSILVSLLPAAEVSLGEDRSFCFGDSVKLMASGNGIAFRWSDDSREATLDLVAQRDQTVFVNARNAAGCVASDTLTIRTIRPELDVSAGQVICPGDSVALSASASEMYQWDNGSLSSSITVNPLETTTFSVVGSTEGCPLTDSILVTVRPRASVSLLPPTPLCPGDDLTLTAQGDAPFRWEDGSNLATLVVAPVVTTNFTVFAGEGNCADSATVTVNILPPAVLDLIGPEEICLGDTARIVTDLQGIDQTVSWNDGATETDRLFVPLLDTHYRVTAERDGCVVTDSLFLSVNPLPQLSLLTTECNDDNTSYRGTVSVTGGTPPYISTGGIFEEEGVLLLPPTPSDTSFFVVVTDAKGCVQKLTEEVACGCQVIALRAPERRCNAEVNSLLLTSLLPEDAPAGTWSVLNQDVNGLPRVTNASLTINGASPGTYLLQFFPLDAVQACLGNYQTEITVEAPPSAGQQTNPDPRCRETAGLIDLFAELSNADPGGEWTAISPELSDNPAFDPANGILDPGALTAGTYRFRYQAPAGINCPGGTTELSIELVEVSVAGEVVPPVCADDCSGQIQIVGYDPLFRYTLDDGTVAATSTFADLCAGDYLLLAVNDLGCAATTRLTVPEVRPPQIRLAGPELIRLGDTAILTLSADRLLDSISWSGPGNCLEPACFRYAVAPLVTTDFSVRALTSFGCVTTATYTVFVEENVDLYVPNVFSPNEDGTNDRTSVFSGPGIDRVVDFRIFDRWGNLVFEAGEQLTNDTNLGWDGTFGGQPAPPAVYTYRLRFRKINGVERYRSGTIVLFR